MAQKKVSAEHEAYKSRGKKAGKDSLGPAHDHELHKPQELSKDKSDKPAEDYSKRGK
jgi:hypothetical protein